MRNKDVVSNVDLLYNNSTPNWIMLKFWNSHFWNPDILLESFRKEGLFSDWKIKDIKTILKEKWISYIEITPKK